MTDLLKRADDFLQLITDSEDGPPTQRSPLALAEPTEDFRICKELRDTMLGRGMRVGKVHKDVRSGSYFNLPYPEKGDYTFMFRAIFSELGPPTVQEESFAKWKLFKLTVTLVALENRIVVKAF